MYRKSRHADELPEIGLYFEGRLNPENCGVKLAARLLRHELEADSAKHFKSSERGEVALNVRMAMGALLVKEFPGVSDRAVVDAVSENPYLAILSRFQTISNGTAFQRFIDDQFSKTFLRKSRQSFQ